MFDNIRRDFARSILSKKKELILLRILFRATKDAGFRSVFFYRIARKFRKYRIPVIPAIIERLMHHLCHCWISSLADIGPGFVVAHVCGIIIPPGIIIGKDCDIRQNVTLGGNYGKKNEDGRTNPKICNNVSIGANAVILGPVTIGSHSIIGANATVTKSIPEHSVVAGFRSEIIAKCEDNTDYHKAIIVRPEKNIFLSRKQLFERINDLESELKTLEERLKNGI